MVPNTENVKCAKVTTDDEKDISRVTHFDKEHITVYKKGFLRDEEIDIPISAIIDCNYEKKIGGKVMVTMSLHLY